VYKEITIIALGVFVLSYTISRLFCKYCQTKTCKKQQDQNFWILVMICLPILAIIIGHYSGLWDYIDKTP